MAKNFTIARPYARAVFKEASEAHQLQEWLHVLQGLAMIAADPDVSRLLVNPKLLEKQVIDFFYDLIQKLAEQFVQPISEKAHNFLAILCSDKRLTLLPDIALLYQSMLAEREGIVKVEVISAQALEAAQQNKMQKALEDRFKSKVSVDYRQDQSLIGGVLIRAGNWVMDGSIKGKLAKLGDSLRG